MFSKEPSTTFFIAVLLFSSTACNSFSKIQRSKDWREKYQAAVKYYEAKKYYKAEQLLEEVVPLSRGSEEAQLAQFYQAYCSFHRKDYRLSAYYFKNFYETYPRNPQVEEAMYMRAYALYIASPDVKLDQAITQKAIQALEAYLHQHPNGTYSNKATEYLHTLREKLMLKAYNNAKLYHQLEHYHAATNVLENFQKDFPASPFNEEAAYLQVDAQYLLAKESTEEKKKDHFYTTIEYCQRFFNKYPDSPYTQKIEKIYEYSLTQINKLTQTKKTSSL